MSDETMAYIVRHGFNPKKLRSTVSYTCSNCYKHISSEDNYCKNCGVKFNDVRDCEHASNNEEW